MSNQGNKSGKGDATFSSSSVKSTSAVRQSRELNLPRVIPGVSIGRGGLRLGTGLNDGNKKKFVPNLNVQRREGSAESTPGPIKKEIKQEADSSTGSTFKRHDGGRGGGAGRGRGAFKRPEFIQTLGAVFADGIGDDAIHRRSGWGAGGRTSDGGGDSKALIRPKIDLKSLDQKYDRAAEDEKLKELMRDDFISDLSTGNFVPVQLPMIDTGKVFTVDDDEDEDELKIMRGGNQPRPKKNIIRDDDEDDGQQPEVKEVKKDPISKAGKDNQESRELQFSDLVVGQGNGDLLFIQLPDHLPRTTSDDGKTRSSLDNLDEGYLGKIQIRASGKTQLQIGDVLLDVGFGTQVGFLQELVSVQLPEDPDIALGQISVLGRVRHRLIVTPEWNQLFGCETELDDDGDDEDID